MFYTLTKIHKPTPVGRPIISGCDGPTDRISAFVDHLIQPIAQKQASYLIKIQKTFLTSSKRLNCLKIQLLSQWTSPASTRTYPRRRVYAEAYEDFYERKPLIRTRYLREILSLILQENSFQLNGKDYLQTHGAAMGTKMGVAFANIFMVKTEKEILRQSDTKPIVWKRFIDDVISMWNTSRDKIEDFLLKANSFHPTIKFTAETSETETTFLDTKVHKGVRFTK